MLFPDLRPDRTTDRPLRVRSRVPTAGDGADMWRIAQATTLDRNSPYAYVLWGDQFGRTSRIAEDRDGPVGFVTGHLVPDRPDTLFVWQVGVAGRARGRGVASLLLDDVWAANDGVRFLEATVTPSNAASDRLFRSFAARRGAQVRTEVAYGEDLFPGDDHEAEVRYRIGPVAAREHRTDDNPVGT